MWKKTLSGVSSSGGKFIMNRQSNSSIIYEFILGGIIIFMFIKISTFCNPQLFIESYVMNNKENGKK
jgi:hypothetical protein